jgi:hypothetical protein
MKRKKNQKPENSKTIDLALLEEILGGAQVAGDGTKVNTVIAQVPFSSFFHS